MEGQSSIIIVHLDIPVVFFADLADAFQPEAVRTLIRFGSGWICRIILKGFTRQELTTVIRTKGVFSRLLPLTSI